MVTSDRSAGKHKGYPLKMTEEQHEMLFFVLEHSTDKSVQKLLDSIIWPEIKRRYTEIRKSGDL